MAAKKSKIILENLQVKSIDKAKKLAKALEVIEEECGIHEVEITIKDFFVCPWINFGELQSTNMEKLLSELFIKSQAR